ncbi:SURF1 family protein [Cellulosimicrobium sp. PMB13]|uniref:SURF1 family protein n=1 Tax=Cellulosimicrobium sp. PMB13 TaxID=3120158 RepID=UPI003F4BD74C
MPETAPRRSLWEVARQPRMIGLLVLFLAAAMVCARLGVWQLDRAQQRAELAAQQEAAEAAAEGPEGLGILLPPQSTFPGELVGRQAWVEGEYDAAGQLLVAGRALDGEVGYLVLTPLHVTDDGTGGDSWADLSGAPVLPVVRGWVASPDDPVALQVPDGEVRLTGYLQASEAAGEEVLPQGQTDSISTGSLVNAWGGPMYSGYLVLIASDPPQTSPADGGPALLPRPTIEGGTGLNLQNLFYALQWWVFGGFAVLLWLRLVRDEAAGVRRGSRGDDDGIAGLPGDRQIDPSAPTSTL